MWGSLTFAVLGLAACSAVAQPADCPTVSPPALSQRLSIDLKGRPGVPSGVSGKATIAVPLQAPQTECGEPSAPTDILRGAHGDLLRGTPPPAQTGR